jgi:hypothetical protein
MHILIRFYKGQVSIYIVLYNCSSNYDIMGYSFQQRLIEAVQPAKNCWSCFEYVVFVVVNIYGLTAECFARSGTNPAYTFCYDSKS